METQTFDIYFNDSENSNNKGFKQSYHFCMYYITTHGPSNDPYFKDYKGGTVSVICNETGESVFNKELKG